LWIYGPANYGKSYLMEQLSKKYKIYRWCWGHGDYQNP